MGGGKETPRQKMISMMYIVLTALLALNVSKQILDAFVAIEANIQKGALTQLDRGDELKSDLSQELASSKGEEEAAKRKKIEVALKTITDIDKETQVVIKNIDDAKLLLLEKLGELNPTPKDNDKDAILWVKYSNNDPLRPSKLNLTALQSKDEFDTPMRELGIKELENIDKAGVGMKKVWEPYKNYRKRLVEICGTYKVEGKGYSVVLKGAVDKFADNKALEKDVTSLVTKGNKPNAADIPELVTIYSELTKNELDDYGHDGDIQKNVHWLGRTFYHSPMIAAIASLSTLQYEVLAARTKAVGMIKSRISTGEYSFNTIMAMAYPSVAVVESGDKFEVAVWMAAFDSDKEPKVKPGQGTLKGVKDGVATLEMTASGSNEMQIKGSVGIANKMGTVKWKDYTTKVFIAQKGGGSIGLPLQTALYADWDNKITAASGGANIKSMTVSCNGKTCSKQGNYYVARVAAVKGGAKITVTAKDKNDKSVTFSQTFPIKPFPEPTVVTKSLSSKGGPIFVGLPDGSVLSGVNFSITSMKVGSTNVNGNMISANALRAYSPGSVVGVSGMCKRTDTGKSTPFKGAITIQ
jgi:GldM C-terminal domain/GldM N-terminal domain